MSKTEYHSKKKSHQGNEKYCSFPVTAYISDEYSI